MQTSEITNKTLEKQIEEINEILKELQYNEKEKMRTLKKNYAVIMKKIDKVQEYNKISDMTNQIFEKRLLAIENAIIKLNSSISIKNNL